MALGLLFVIVAVLTTVTGYFFPPADITPAQAVDGTTLLFLCDDCQPASTSSTIVAGGRQTLAGGDMSDQPDALTMPVSRAAEPAGVPLPSRPQRRAFPWAATGIRLFILLLVGAPHCLPGP